MARLQWSAEWRSGAQGRLDAISMRLIGGIHNAVFIPHLT